MSRILFFILFQLFVSVFAFAQQGDDSSNITIADSTIQRDSMMGQDSLSILPAVDSICKRPQKDRGWRFSGDSVFFVGNLSFQILQHHPYFNFSKRPIATDNVKSFQGNELLFYVLVFLLLIYAMLRRIFSKYFNDLYRLFFRTTLKQLQLREQMMQAPLPSFLLNVFFVVSTGLYINFLLKYEQLIQQNFWLTFLYCMAGLSLIYFVKFVGLKLSGWLFNMKEAANSYIFIVFIINKMIGLLLLPFLVLLAYAQDNIYSVSLLLSWIVLATLLTYRFILTYSAVRKQVKVNPFHFFLYLCAFEIAPLLLIYKWLLVFFHITT